MHPEPPHPSAQFQRLCGSRLEEFDGLVRALSDWAAPAGVPPQAMRDVVLILDELFSNIIIHGYRRDPAGQILVRAQRDDGRVDVTLTDQAPAFNPTQVPEPDTQLSIDDRPMGGLGLLFVRRTADDFDYHLIDTDTGTAANQVHFSKRFGKVAGSV